MTALPFADGSVEGVVVIDALHHVPDVPGVFREAYRVLGPGGQFLLAEPGEGHAEAEKSRAECSDHGVCEGEIHPFEVMRHAEAAGFDSVRVVPHYVPGAYFAPDDLRAAMREPSERWSIQLAGAPARFDALVLQSIFCHPILVFGKGQRALDSRAPGRLAAASGGAARSRRRPGPGHRAGAEPRRHALAPRRRRAAASAWASSS